MTDYFAPMGRTNRLEELLKARDSMPIIPLPLSTNALKTQLDSADRFTYIIMGLAVLIAIVVPLLNLS